MPISQVTSQDSLLSSLRVDIEIFMLIKGLYYCHQLIDIILLAVLFEQGEILFKIDGVHEQCNDVYLVFSALHRISPMHLYPLF